MGRKKARVFENTVLKQKLRSWREEVTTVFCTC